MSTSAEIEAVSATRTKRRALARVSPLASVAATLACGALLLPPAVSHVDQPSITAEPACPDVEVVFARGTAEPPGAAQMKAAVVKALGTPPVYADFPDPQDGDGAHR